eukprot:7716151-Lingulodinium_polyedra.AAC.1
MPSPGGIRRESAGPTPGVPSPAHGAYPDEAGARVLQVEVQPAEPVPHAHKAHPAPGPGAEVW